MFKATAAGDTALLLDTKDPPAWLAAAIEAAALPGVRDVVPGAQTVLVITEPGSTTLDQLASAIGSLPVVEPAAGETELVEIPVIYDGPDLADVAELAGMTVQDVIERHSNAAYTVGWLGFAPGFGYLTGLDERLAGVPRLATPRLAVPAGSVAIAAGLAAVYPSQSPGGWRLLGRTSIRTWDVDREPAALFSPGTKVRFIPVNPAPQSRAEPAGTKDATTGPEILSPQPPSPEPGAVTHHQPPPAGPQPPPPATGPQPRPPPVRAAGPRIEVIRPGPFATVQDLGRPGSAAVGVPPSGAADPASLIAANRLVGNPDGAAGIELTLGRAALRCFGGLRLALAGAPASVTLADAPASVTLADEPGQPPLEGAQRTVEVEFGSSIEVLDGGLVSIGPPTAGLRTYIAVAGGLATPAVLGSRSVDVLSKLGGGALRPGDVLAVGPRRRPPPLAGSSAPPRSALPPRGAVAQLRVVPGPRLDWFEADALGSLFGSIYTVSPASNRTGLRLSGPPLPRITGRELPSEGMVTGSIEVPPDGQPILLLADHPTVGGYPVIAVVISADIGLAAQLRPGDQISFTATTSTARRAPHQRVRPARSEAPGPSRPPPAG